MEERDLAKPGKRILKKSCGQSASLMETPCDFSSEDRWRKVLMQDVHNSTCQRSSTNMLKYLKKFPLITHFLTSGWDSDHFRALVETTADVIPHIWHPFLPWRGIRRRSTWHAALTGLPATSKANIFQHSVANAAAQNTSWSVLPWALRQPLSKLAAVSALCLALADLRTVVENVPIIPS